MTKQHYTTPEEKAMVVKIHAYLKSVDDGCADAIAGGLRKRVAMCSGISRRTVDRILGENKANDDSFLALAQLPARRRPSFSYGEDIIYSVRKIINEKNLAAQPTSVKDLQSRLIELSLADNEINERTLNRRLHRAGFYFGTGLKRNVLVESDYVIALRVSYLRNKLANRTPSGLPIVPEVFLDESYCHQHHNKGSSWFEKANKTQYTKGGKGKRMVMVGAGVVYTTGNSLSGAFVHDSLKFWDSSVKASEDYHGNLTAAIFEDWFELVCYNLMMDFGSCYIYMDGAVYHVRQLNPVPNIGWRKCAIEEWLAAQGIPWNSTMLKPELLALSYRVHTQKKYATVEIAANFGHRVFFTPPYHHELQPIEKIWVVAKNHVAAQKYKGTMKQLKANPKARFATVTSKTWAGVYRAVQQVENEFPLPSIPIAAGVFLLHTSSNWN